MPRDLVVCCDGTANEFARDHTNVLKLFSALVHDPERQLAYYHPGVGTMEAAGALTSAARSVSKLLGKAIGYGDYARATPDAPMHESLEGWWRLAEFVPKTRYNRDAAAAGTPHEPVPPPDPSGRSRWSTTSRSCATATSCRPELSASARTRSHSVPPAPPSAYAVANTTVSPTVTRGGRYAISPNCSRMIETTSSWQRMASSRRSNSVTETARFGSASSRKA